ncbi:hypothetical protein [Mixta calida]|uniref:hypothetical protein n=1 Tax=Mixta calida TaxID=665913 RepID=UPI002FDA5205
MKKEEKYGLYEKLYFHENDVKEKLHARVQGVFAFFALVITAIAYIFKNTSSSPAWVFYTINILLSLTAVLIFLAAWKLKKAFWGNKYARLATPKEISVYEKELMNYHSKMKKYNEDYPHNAQPLEDVEQSLRDWICSSFEEASSVNIEVNAMRSEMIHEAVLRLFYGLIPLAVAMALFLSFNLDSSAPRNSSSPKSIIIVNNPMYT